jgi:hypothetical protein
MLTLRQGLHSDISPCFVRDAGSSWGKSKSCNRGLATRSARSFGILSVTLNFRGASGLPGQFSSSRGKKPKRPSSSLFPVKSARAGSQSVGPDPFTQYLLLRGNLLDCDGELLFQSWFLDLPLAVQRSSRISLNPCAMRPGDHLMTPLPSSPSALGSNRTMVLVAGLQFSAV